MGDGVWKEGGKEEEDLKTNLRSCTCRCRSLLSPMKALLVRLLLYHCCILKALSSSMPVPQHRNRRDLLFLCYFFILFHCPSHHITFLLFHHFTPHHTTTTPHHTTPHHTTPHHTTPHHTTTTPHHTTPHQPPALTSNGQSSFFHQQNTGFLAAMHQAVVQAGVPWCGRSTQGCRDGKKYKLKNLIALKYHYYYKKKTDSSPY